MPGFLRLRFPPRQPLTLGAHNRQGEAMPAFLLEHTPYNSALAYKAHARRAQRRGKQEHQLQLRMWGKFALALDEEAVGTGIEHRPGDLPRTVVPELDGYRLLQVAAL